MLRSIKSLEGYAIHGRDGHLGRVEEFFFDDEKWAVRYLVVRAGRWPRHKDVLLPVQSIEKCDWHESEFVVGLSAQELGRCPDPARHLPPSRRYEGALLDYYHAPYYWEGPALWGPGPFPVTFQRPVLATSCAIDLEEDDSDTHLRSSRQVMRDIVRATDGDFGRVEDLIVEDESWAVRYLVAGQRLVAPLWLRGVDWRRGEVLVDLSRQALNGSPSYDARAPINREYESALFDYYGRPKYWESYYPGEFKDRVSYTIF